VIANSKFIPTTLIATQNLFQRACQNQFKTKVIGLSTSVTNQSQQFAKIFDDDLETQRVCQEA